MVGIHPALMPLVGVFMGSLPLMWLLFRRKRRLKAFAAQLPDALEMLARTLRAGQSLAFGFNMVATEMPAPISKEFGHVFEEQNLGIPLDETLRSLTNRIPNLDLKFFVTAVILQRQTGGDLAEILDKIGALIRDRFRIWGQVQALDGRRPPLGRCAAGAALRAVPGRLPIEPRVRHGPVQGSDGHEDVDRGRHHANHRSAGDSEDREHQGMRSRFVRRDGA